MAQVFNNYKKIDSFGKPINSRKIDKATTIPKRKIEENKKSFTITDHKSTGVTKELRELNKEKQDISCNNAYYNDYKTPASTLFQSSVSTSSIKYSNEILDKEIPSSKNTYVPLTSSIILSNEDNKQSQEETKAKPYSLYYGNTGNQEYCKSL